MMIPHQNSPQVSLNPFPKGFKKKYHGPKPIVLLILDGWGLGKVNPGNAIIKAKTPHLDYLSQAFPHTQLEASGLAVGLPHKVEGNSETGHLNIGAGRIVYQDLPRINTAIADGSFNQNQAFLDAIEHVKKKHSKMHLIGLIGSGFVHSNLEHLFALLHLCQLHQLDQAYIHGFTDGRDSPPNSAINYIREILNECQQLKFGVLASLIGRYYAMDRNKRWERVEKAYNALTIGDGSCSRDPIEALQRQYEKNITDEFIEPINFCDEHGAVTTINDNDAVIFFNYRIDRPRELTRAFVMPNFEKGIYIEDYDPYLEKYEKTHLQQAIKQSTFKRKKIVKNLCFVTMTTYDKDLPVKAAFKRQRIQQTLGEILSNHGVKQLRMTESEKERMVTYYLNGHHRTAFYGEDRIIFPSKKVKSYDLLPAMSAQEIQTELVKQINKNYYDVIIVNLANPDMVAHSGKMKAAIEACEVTDQFVGRIVEAVWKQNGYLIITADHGNIEEMLNKNSHTADTEHSTNPVPFIIVAKKFENSQFKLLPGILADIAPTMLHLMDIPKAPKMTGHSLI